MTPAIKAEIEKTLRSMAAHVAMFDLSCTFSPSTESGQEFQREMCEQWHEARENLVAHAERLRAFVDVPFDANDPATWTGVLS